MTFVLFASAAPPLQAAKDLANRLEDEARERREIRDLIKQVNDKITGRKKASPEEVMPEKKREIEKAVDQAIAYMKHHIPDYHRYGPIRIFCGNTILLTDSTVPDEPGKQQNGAAHNLFCLMAEAIGGYNIKLFDAAMKTLLNKAEKHGFKIEVGRPNKFYRSITIHPPQPS